MPLFLFVSVFFQSKQVIHFPSGCLIYNINHLCVTAHHFTLKMTKHGLTLSASPADGRNFVPLKHFYSTLLMLSCGCRATLGEACYWKPCVYFRRECDGPAGLELADKMSSSPCLSLSQGCLFLSCHAAA